MKLHIIIIITCIILFTGCTGSGKDSNTIVTNKSLGIEIIGKGRNSRFWELVEEGAGRAAVSYSVDLIFKTTASDADVDEQLEMLESAVNNGTNVICIAGLDDERCEEYYIRAKEKGIPVIVFDSEIISDNISTNYAMDNYEAASLAADKLAEEIGEGEVAIISHSKTSNTGAKRQDGFKYKMIEEYEGITIIDTQYSDGDAEKAEAIAGDLIGMYPGLKGIFGTNEATMKGIINAIRGTKRFDIKLIGFDSGFEQIEAVKDGTLIGFISQNPINVGYKLVELGIKAARDERLDPDVSVEYEWIDLNNIYDESVQPFVYE